MCLLRLGMLLTVLHASFRTHAMFDYFDASDSYCPPSFVCRPFHFWRRMHTMKTSRVPKWRLSAIKCSHHKLDPLLRSWFKWSIGSFDTFVWLLFLLSINREDANESNLRSAGVEAIAAFIQDGPSASYEVVRQTMQYAMGALRTSLQNVWLLCSWSLFAV